MNRCLYLEIESTYVVQSLFIQFYVPVMNICHVFFNLSSMKINSSVVCIKLFVSVLIVLDRKLTFEITLSYDSYHKSLHGLL
jgi:hypothetical protein